MYMPDNWIYSIEISDKLWEKILQLEGAVDDFTPNTKERGFKLWPAKQDGEYCDCSPEESFYTVRMQVKWLIHMGQHSDAINKRFKKVHDDLILATTDSYWLLTELRSRTDKSALKLYGILRSMQILLIDHKQFKLEPLNFGNIFEHKSESRPGQTQDNQTLLHELLLQLKEVNSSCM